MVHIFAKELSENTELEDPQHELVAGMVASGVTYAYLDWLAGRYGGLTLDELVTLCERFARGAQNT